MAKKLSFITVLSLLLLHISTVTSIAQTPVVGLHVGANMDQTIGKDLKGKFNGTFLVGLYGGLRFKKVGVNAELNFSQTTITTGDNFRNAFGNYIKSSASNVKEGTFKLNELSIPVLISYNVYSRLWIQLGPQYTAVVSIKDKNEFLNAPKEVFKTGYISGVAGLWVDLPFHLKVSGRYIFGISDRNNSTVDQTWRTGQVQLAVGYSFL